MSGGSFPIEEWESRAAEVVTRLYGAGSSPMGRNAMAAHDPELAELLQVIARGRFYADPVVDLKTRALCTMACLVAIGEQRYIETWIANAMTAGATAEEVASILGQLFVYVGTVRSVTGYEALAAVLERSAASDASGGPSPQESG